MRTLFAIVALIAFVVPVAGAEELRLGVQGSIEHDSNLFNSPTTPIQDWVVRTGPLLGLRENQGNFVYELRYEPRFETFIDGTAPDAWDHNAFGRATWQMTGRTSLEATNRFLITRSLNRAGFITDPAAPDAGPTGDIEVARQRIKRNLAAAKLIHMFTPRLTGTASLSYDLFRTDRKDRFDSDVYGGSLDTTYVLTPGDQVGAGFGVTYQNFNETETQPGRETTLYRLYATWFHSFDPTFTLSVQGGPTFISSDQTSTAPSSAVVPAFPFESTERGGVRLIDSTTCPTTDDGQPFVADRCGLFSTELTGASASAVRRARRLVMQADATPDAGVRTTIFANIELQKRWDHFRAIARFQRTDATSSGLGQSTVLNALSGRLIWEPTNRWSIAAAGTWSLRESATGQTANGIGLGPPQPLFFAGTGVTAQGSPSVNLRIVDSDNLINVTTYTASLTASRFIGKQSRVFVRYLYVNQSFDGTTATREFDNHRIMVGFRLILDWIRL